VLQPPATAIHCPQAACLSTSKYNAGRVQHPETRLQPPAGSRLAVEVAAELSWQHAGTILGQLACLNLQEHEGAWGETLGAHSPHTRGRDDWSNNRGGLPMRVACLPRKALLSFNYDETMPMHTTL